MADDAYIHYLVCKNNSDVSTPEKLSYNKWDIWEEAVRNWLKTKRVVTNLPISYVIFKDTTPITMDHSDLIIVLHANWKGAVYLEAGTRRAGVEELNMILPPWSIERERVGSLLMWF